MTAHRWRAWGSKHCFWRWRCRDCGEVAYYVQDGGRQPERRPRGPNLPQTNDGRPWPSECPVSPRS